MNQKNSFDHFEKHNFSWLFFLPTVNERQQTNKSCLIAEERRKKAFFNYLIMVMTLSARCLLSLCFCMFVSR
jgi:hypothetical protein